MSNVACESAEIMPRSVYSVPARVARACGGERPDPSWGSGCVGCGNLMGQRMGKLQYGDESQECVVVCHEMVSMPWTKSPLHTAWPVRNGVARRAGGGGLGGHVPSRSGARRAGRVPTKGRRFARTNVASYFNNHGSLIVIKTPTRRPAGASPVGRLFSDFSTARDSAVRARGLRVGARALPLVFGGLGPLAP